MSKNFISNSFTNKIFQNIKKSLSKDFININNNNKTNKNNYIINKITNINTLKFSNKKNNILNNKNISKFNHSSKENNQESNEKVKFYFRFLNGKPDVHVEAPIGRNILLVAHDNDIPLEGACECSLACSTCHVIFESEVYNELNESKGEEEDLLDLAFGLTETSRLGCQVLVSKKLEGAKISLPSATRNFFVDKDK
jgi:ferredoxin